jgi:hypothetical protein
MEPRPDSLFLCSELWVEPKEYPSMYHSTEIPTPQYEVEYSGSVRIKIWGRERFYNLEDEGLRKIVHEVVSTVQGPVTDEKLSIIGVEGPLAILTPDFILEDSKGVLEIGTCAGSDDSALTSMYKGKCVKYEKLVKDRGYSLGVIIVGRSKVFSNLPLTQAAVNALVLRFRVGYAVAAKLTDKIGENIFSEEWSQLENHCKEVMKTMQEMPTPEDDGHFDLETILSMKVPPTKLESARTGKILREALNSSTKKSPESEIDLQKYIHNFDMDSKRDRKRVTNIPMVVCDMTTEDVFLDPEQSNMPDWMKSIWCQAREVANEKEKLGESIDEAMGRKEFTKHRLQKDSAFNVALDDRGKLEAAKSGLWAKSLKDMPDIIEKDRISHLSFHPTETPTDDIERFIHSDTLTQYKERSSIPEDIWKVILDAKMVSGSNSISPGILRAVTSSKLSWFAQMISELFTEICYSYKYWIKRSDFYHKVHKGVHMLIRCTGDHTFVTFAFPKAGTEVLDTGRIGPTLWESDKFYFTKFASYNEPTVEHFVKAGPYVTSIYCHLLSHYEIGLSDVKKYDDDILRTMNSVLLLYLNNKTDVEELITNQRYLTMGILEEMDPNPYRFVDRLPDVFRSRLTCHFLKQTIFHLNYYSNTKVVKTKTGVEDDEGLDHNGLISIFTNRPVTLKQKVNEFYFGYVISKERGRGSDRNFKIMKKIVAEEYRFRDTVKKTFEDSLDIGVHVSNPIVMKVFMSIFRKHLHKTYGKDWELVLTKAIYSAMARKSFYEIATMKVASRTYGEKINVPTMPQEATTHEIRDHLEKANPNEKKRRPRVMEALKNLIDQYIEETGEEPTHPVDLLPYCLNKLKMKGYFDSDIFPKPQHGGDREIHVLEIQMRIVQLFTETIARTMCEHIDSDSLTHPKSKDNFVKNHYKQANESLKGNFITLGKSADATKWCQRHHSSKFAAVMVGCIPQTFHGFLLTVMEMWTRKRITFPIQFAANFMSNEKVKSNPIYERMRSDFYKGTTIFKEPYNNKMWIKSGMMQGILHYVSSLTHAVLQEVMKIIQLSYLRSKRIRAHITVIQGSDDSAELISLSGAKPTVLSRIGTTMLHWKENMGKFFSIYTSRAKSSIGTIDLIEYNSEWSIRSTTIKPTFRWVSSCLETGIVEKFVDRFQNMQGTLTTVLEGGGKLLEVAMIQLCQAWMHYMLMGLHTSILSELASYYLVNVRDPALGYFPLDSDYTAGVTGFNYSLYELYSKTSYGHGLGRTNMRDVEIDFFEDDTRDPAIGKDLRKARIRFGDHKIFLNILRDMSIPELSKIVDEVEKDPSLLYFPSHDWSTSKFRIFLKVFEPGVKESLSRHSATARMMSASAYMLSRPCFSMAGNDKKCSLLYLLAQQYHTPKPPKTPVHLVFLHANEYSELSKFVSSLETNSYLRHQNIKTRSKQKIVVFDAEDDGPSLIDMCKRKWFDRGNLPLSSRQFNMRWESLKKQYLFLSDFREETKQNLKMTDIQLKNFLEAQSEKVRSITLMDTAAKASSIQNCITRIFWSNTKIIQSREDDDDDTSHGIRSRMFSLLTSWMPYAELRKEVTNQLLSSETLSQNRVPHRIAKLKCVRDLIATGNKFEIVERVLREKLGSIGFFTIRQNGYGESRSGYGEWKGRVLDTSVKIEMIGNTCQAIHVNNLARTKELGQMLAQLVNGFCLKPSDIYFRSEHWLSRTGRVSYGKGQKQSIPIIISPELKVEIVDQITDYNWTWDINYNRIRILATLPGRIKEKITILSESFTSGDWDPFHGIEGNSDIALWSRGERISVDQIRNEFAPFFGKTRKQLLKDIKNLNKLTTVNGWSVKKVVEMLKYFYPKTDYVRMEDQTTEDDDSEFGEQEMMALMEFVNLEEGELDEDLGVTYEEDDEDLDLFQINENELADIDAQLEILLQQADPSLVPRLDRTKMPISNQFFYNLNVLSLSSHNMNLSELWTRFHANESLLTHDILGILLTFMCERICIRSPLDDEEEVLKAEQESISLITSIKSEMEVDDLNEEELKWMIKKLEDDIPKAPERLQPKMKSSLKRYKIALKLISIPNHDSFDLDSMSAEDVIYTVSQVNKKKTFSTTPRIALTQARLFIDNRLDDLLNHAEITPHEHAIYRESLFKSYCTPMLIDAIALSFEAIVKILNYESGENPDNVIDLNQCL